MNSKSYQVLARKWRPHSFKDMVGQEHILRMLSNALTQQRIHHAYLFTGTRGVGKTTLARIFAKCLNCESGITATPCDTCHACRSIDAGQFLDLYEVDAASRTKVEDTRELLDNVLYPPTTGRYKIYLIDEVHMLSNHSFNALLKTLEEPPEHVKFLLATTDPKKLPITILSRCLQFHLKRITPEQITAHLTHICATENIIHEVAALQILAKAADGSMRDALSLLDQAIAYGNGTINKNDIATMLSCLADDDLLPLLESLIAKDGKALFTNIKLLAERAPDFQQLLEAIISIFHHLAIAQIVPETLAHDDPLAAYAKQITPEDVQLYYQIALLGRRDLAFAPSPLQGFEMTMLRMLAFQPNALTTSHSLIDKKNNSAEFKCTEPTLTNITNTTPIIAAEKVAQHHTEIHDDNLNVWRDLLPKLELSGMAYALASNCSLIKMTDNKIELALSANHAPMLNPKLKERITEALTRQLKKPIQLEIVTTSNAINTPVKQQQQEQSHALARAKENIMQNPNIKKLIDVYDATVDVYP